MKSRRKFTKDFEQTAVSRLNSGQSVAEVARALEVHPSDLHRWRRELQDYGEQAFVEWARNAPKRAGWPSWNARSASRPCRSIFASLAACRGTAPAAGTEQRRAFYGRSTKK